LGHLHDDGVFAPSLFTPRRNLVTKLDYKFVAVVKGVYIVVIPRHSVTAITPGITPDVQVHVPPAILPHVRQ
jgi:hypothetical protein